MVAHVPDFNESRVPVLLRSVESLCGFLRHTHVFPTQSRALGDHLRLVSLAVRALVDIARTRRPRMLESKQERGHRLLASYQCFSRVAVGLLAFVSSILARSTRLIRLIDDHHPGTIQGWTLQVVLLLLPRLRVLILMVQCR